jgi:7,8-dihydroneopterin aldolase/epimerase/oxygenase
MADQITLKSLSIEGKHGYYDTERENGNRFEIDLTASGNFREAIRNNDLTRTFDYEQADKIVRQVMEGESELLIETLCNKIGEQIFRHFSHVDELTVSVRKLNPPIKSAAQYAQITMTWRR